MPVFYDAINLATNQLEQARIENLGSDPGSGVEGQIYFNTTSDKLRIYANGAWADVGGASGVTSFTNANGTFVSATTANTTATGAVTVGTIDLSATGTPSNTKFLRGDNVWATTGTMSSFILTGDSGTNQTIADGNTLDIAGGTNISTVVGGTDTVTVKLDDSVTLAGQLTVSGTGQNAFTGQVTIPSIPSAGTDAASKNYVDTSVAGSGALIYQGGYNAATNTPDLDSSPSASIKKGWTYTVTADGTFFTEQVRVGDLLIAESNSPTALADWTTVQNNVDLADLTTVGIGNVNAATSALRDGLAVSYSAGTATVGLDITSLTNLPATPASGDSLIIYDTSDSQNKKITVANLLSGSNGDNTFATTISATGAVTHSLGTKDVMVQLYDTVTDLTVYARVDRNSTSQVTITFGTTPANNVRVLIQKIG